MASELIVSVSGIRGIVGQGLTPEATVAFAAALGTFAKGGSMVLSRDGRPSGLMLRHAVLAGLMGAGCEVQDIGVTPTPTFGLAITRLKASGGVQITASHNPAEWNGLKLFGPGGNVLNVVDGQRIKDLFDSRQFIRVDWNNLGSVMDCHKAETWHRERVQELVDVPLIRSRQFRVLLDANGGAGGPLGKELLEALGCKVDARACLADGNFVHEPEPIAANLTEVSPLVSQGQSALGFVLDPDADRLAIIDEEGRYIGEELTLALAVRFRLEQERGPVVVNMSTSRVVEDLCQRFGVTCHRAPVGEANVVEKMREVGALIGGEGNGGVIDPRVGWVRDPFIGMGLILNLMARTDSKLSALVADLPRYHIVKDKCTVDRSNLGPLLERLEKRWPDARANRLDGLRLDWVDRWIHVRPSNTEPIVRVIAEAPEEGQARQLCREIATELANR